MNSGGVFSRLGGKCLGGSQIVVPEIAGDSFVSDVPVAHVEPVQQMGVVCQRLLVAFVSESYGEGQSCVGQRHS